jgi:phage terminase small subunit
MKQRGRKSAASQTVISLVDVSQYRPSAPAHLTKEQQQLWDEICASMKPGSFPPSMWPLLSLYCVHTCRSRFIAAELRKLDPGKDWQKFRAWACMHRSESNTMCMLATKLRLLPKANTRLDRQVSSDAPWNINRKPWEDDAAS